MANRVTASSQLGVLLADIGASAGGVLILGVLLLGAGAVIVWRVKRIS